MRVLVACEFSGIVRDAFIARGHDAISVDLLPSERPGPHIQGDALEAVYARGPWDLLIAHPPCTYLANSGVRWLYETPVRYDADGERIQDATRWNAMYDAAAFFAMFVDAPVERVAVENPIMHKWGREKVIGLSRRGADMEVQTVQPWMFGHMETKATQLWLRGLPELTPTNDVREQMRELERTAGKGAVARVHYASPGPDRWAERSRTLQGLADAMAEQWGGCTE